MPLPLLSLAYEADAYEKMARTETAVILWQRLQKLEQKDGR